MSNNPRFKAVYEGDLRFQYREQNKPGTWIDLPYTVRTGAEARAYLRGRRDGIRSVSPDFPLPWIYIVRRCRNVGEADICL
jgi:hypothetical protein